MIPRWISYVAVLIASILALVEYLNIGWQDSRLPSPWFQSAERKGTTVISVLAAKSLTSRILPGFIVGCLIYTTVSASNTVLYVASRALHGLLRSVPPSAPPLKRLAKFVTSTRRDGTPANAILLSALAFWWLPYTTLASGDSVKDVSHH